jgi:hypothetical protein
MLLIVELEDKLFELVSISFSLLSRFRFASSDMGFNVYRLLTLLKYNVVAKQTWMDTVRGIFNRVS